MSLLEGWEGPLVACPPPPGGCSYHSEAVGCPCLPGTIIRKVQSTYMSSEFPAICSQWRAGGCSHSLGWGLSFSQIVLHAFFPNLPLSTRAHGGCVLSSVPCLCRYQSPTALMRCFTDSNPLSNEMLTCGLDSKQALIRFAFAFSLLIRASSGGVISKENTS